MESRGAKLAIVSTVLLALSGCATSPVPDSETKPVPSDRIIAPKYLEAAPDTGIVTVKRDRGVGGSACSIRFFVDAQPVADLRTSERVVLHLPVGEHVLSAHPNGMCGGGLREVRATVASSAALSFRNGYGGSGDLSINPTMF